MRVGRPPAHTIDRDVGVWLEPHPEIPDALIRRHANIITWYCPQCGSHFRLWEDQVPTVTPDAVKDAYWRRSARYVDAPRMAVGAPGCPYCAAPIAERDLARFS